MKPIVVTFEEVLARDTLTGECWPRVQAAVEVDGEVMGYVDPEFGYCPFVRRPAQMEAFADLWRPPPAFVERIAAVAAMLTP